MEYEFPAELEQLRAELRGRIAESFPDGFPSIFVEQQEVLDASSAFCRKLGEDGLLTLAWPEEYGGQEASLWTQLVVAEEMWGHGEPRGGQYYGVNWIGPSIMAYGTPEQKAKHIPPIVRGDLRWCVGYSEPGAGSDLASLQTKCVDAGDHWVINGQKIWTSGAQWSDWCGMLVRTDFDAKKHDGISFMLVDMHQPGIETRLIKLISGDSPFCETFITDAVAAKDALLGELNHGWTVGKRLLQHERASQTGARPSGARAVPLNEVAKKYVEVDEKGRIADPDLRTRLADHLMHVRAHGLTIARAMAEARGNNSPSNAPSVLKNSASVIGQTQAELTLEIMGHQGLGWEGDDFAPAEIVAVRSWLAGKAMSVYGGSFEIQNNIISKRILGLPETTQSS